MYKLIENDSLFVFFPACFQDGARIVYQRGNQLELHRVCGQSRHFRSH